MNERPAIEAATSQRRDLLLTAVMVCIALTPALLMPGRAALPCAVATLALAAPAVALSWRHGPWMPTPRAELPRIVAQLALRPGDRFCDLGAGDGRIVAWVRRATGARCHGIEASPLPYLAARLRLALGRDPGATIGFGDLYAADLAAYDVVYVWGTAYGVGTERFGRRMREALRPGARLVSYHQPVAGLDDLVHAVDVDGQRPIHVYVVPGGDDQRAS